MKNQITIAETSPKFKEKQVSVKLDQKGTMAKLKDMTTFLRWKQVYPEATLVDSQH